MIKGPGSTISAQCAPQPTCCYADTMHLGHYTRPAPSSNVYSKNEVRNVWLKDQVGHVFVELTCDLVRRQSAKHSLDIDQRSRHHRNLQNTSDTLSMHHLNLMMNKILCILFLACISLQTIPQSHTGM
jgi:hypothetical protein